MSIIITAKNFEITKGIRQAVNGHFEKLSHKADKETDLYVSLEVGKNVDTAEAMMYVKGDLVKTSVSEKDLYVAIELLVDKFKRKVNKSVDKKREYTNESIRYLVSPNRKEDLEPMEKVKEPIVKRKQFDLKPMMEEEAILQMDMLGHDFFFFFNGEIDKTCLLYKRKDGNYGLIESVYN